MCTYLLCSVPFGCSACKFVKSTWIFATLKYLYSSDAPNFPNLCGCVIVPVTPHISSDASGSVTGAGLLYSAKLSALLFIAAPISFLGGNVPQRKIKGDNGSRLCFISSKISLKNTVKSPSLCTVV